MKQCVLIACLVIPVFKVCNAQENHLRADGKQTTQKSDNPRRFESGAKEGYIPSSSLPKNVLQKSTHSQTTVAPSTANAQKEGKATVVHGSKEQRVSRSIEKGDSNLRQESSFHRLRKTQKKVGNTKGEINNAHQAN